MTNEERDAFNGLVAEVDILRQVVLDLCVAAHSDGARKRVSAVFAKHLTGPDTLGDPEFVDKAYPLRVSCERFLDDLHLVHGVEMGGDAGKSSEQGYHHAPKSRTDLPDS